MALAAGRASQDVSDGSRWVRDDLIAGLTVTLVGLPQCLAYALMSGLPPAYGLSTAAVAGFIAAIAGKSAGVVTGPTNTTGLLILAALTPYLGTNGLLDASGLTFLASLTLLAGVLRLVGAQIGAASLVRFVPESVLTGFTAGAGVLIAIMQLDEALGFSNVRGSNMWTELAAVFTADEPIALASVVVTAGTIVAIAGGKKLLPRWPIPLLAIVGAAALSPFLRDAGVELLVVGDRASVPTGWPPGALPSLDPSVYAEFMLPAFAIVLLGTMELTVSARRDGAQPDLKREIQAQGWANVVGAFASAFPASASLTRSALLRLGNAKTRLAAGSAALFVVPIVLFGGKFVGAIPQASLAGVLFITAYNMMNRARMKRIWTTAPGSRLLLFVTFIATLTLPFVYAILIGIGLALVIELAVSARPRLILLQPNGDRLVGVRDGDKPTCVVVQLSGALFFAAVYGLVAQLLAFVPRNAKTVVLDLSHAHHARFAAIEAFEQLATALEKRGQKLGLAGVTPALERALVDLDVQIPRTPFSVEPGSSALASVEQTHGTCNRPKPSTSTSSASRGSGR